MCACCRPPRLNGRAHDTSIDAIPDVVRFARQRVVEADACCLQLRKRKTKGVLEQMRKEVRAEARRQLLRKDTVLEAGMWEPAPPALKRDIRAVRLTNAQLHQHTSAAALIFSPVDLDLRVCLCVAAGRGEDSRGSRGHLPADPWFQAVAWIPLPHER